VGIVEDDTGTDGSGRAIAAIGAHGSARWVELAGDGGSGGYARHAMCDTMPPFATISRVAVACKADGDGLCALVAVDPAAHEARQKPRTAAVVAATRVCHKMKSRVPSAHY
jgi:hypothetical protein